jgi:hypothetical protein
MLKFCKIKQLFFAHICQQLEFHQVLNVEGPFFGQWTLDRHAAVQYRILSQIAASPVLHSLYVLYFVYLLEQE